MNPAEWLRRTAALMPTNPALFRGEHQVANYYAEFANRAAAIAGALRARGIGKGRRVAVLMKNCTEYLEAMYGIWWSGAVAVPINSKLHEREAAWIIEDAGAELVFVSAETGNALAGIRPKCVSEIIAAGTSGFSDLYAVPPMPSPEEISADETIWLFYTSGTTGRPKGVMIRPKT